MAEINVQESSFFKEKKEESNTDFSLVKGALTEKINQLEKLIDGKTPKYTQHKKMKENA